MGIVYNSEKTIDMMKINESDRPISVQIFGSDPKVMGEIAKEISNTADIIDINMGCPAPKVVKNGDGSKLLLNLELAGDIIEAVVKNSQVLVTLKMRKGWDDNNIVAVELAKIAEEKGIKAITIHGRTREQFYTGEADWDIIKQVKQAVNIPVIRKWRYKNQRRRIKNV